VQEEFGKQEENIQKEALVEWIKSINLRFGKHLE
jgi:hypothetical protein